MPTSGFGGKRGIRSRTHKLAYIKNPECLQQSSAIHNACDNERPVMRSVRSRLKVIDILTGCEPL
jgi:hypothetical protein